MMPFPVLIMVESRLFRKAKELESELPDKEELAGEIKDAHLRTFTEFYPGFTFKKMLVRF